MIIDDVHASDLVIPSLADKGPANVVIYGNIIDETYMVSCVFPVDVCMIEHIFMLHKYAGDVLRSVEDNGYITELNEVCDILHQVISKVATQLPLN